ncbi:unnamed protein product [Prorocentrum cordatum]|uniref:Uncharacterized protein n=1 Tax=Prorocentrum cordatum TaxID=2364126 RepID=A0ABN9TTS1_9DINO|nr:unnamed protein product [Polarella glacialis]
MTALSTKILESRYAHSVVCERRSVIFGRIALGKVDGTLFVSSVHRECNDNGGIQCMALPLRWHRGRVADRGIRVCSARSARTAYIACFPNSRAGASILTLRWNALSRTQIGECPLSAGYTVDNCVLIAAEFNSGDASRNKVGLHKVCGTAQWSRKKVFDVFTLRSRRADRERLEELIHEARAPNAGRTRLNGASVGTQEHASHFYCAKCADRGCIEPCTDISLHCRGCTRAYRFTYSRTLRGNMVILLCGARRRAIKRGHACDLNLDILLDKLLQQQGRCHYSGVPLQYLVPNSDWRVSLERLENDFGYAPENTVLIAHEFNTSDFSRGKWTHAVRGTAQWSREKVEFIWGSVRASTAQAAEDRLSTTHFGDLRFP